ncbi:MAG: glycosyltransferase family 2 protein [Candidatus Omnitrophica bacterium]|nr:glycosyltransferase family 2 protein [Candidatus Omnitrophota bacterium]
MPAVSIIIPTYNRGRFLQTAIDSVMRQSYADWELIVVDDGSTDETSGILKDYGHRIRSIYQDNQGPACARNAGVRNATGELIAFLDTDDRWRKRKLELQRALFWENPGCYITHTEETWYRHGRFLNPLKKHRKQSGDIFWQAVKLCAVSMSTVLLRREVFDRIGYFDETFPVCEDYEFWLRASACYPILLLDKKLTLKEGGHTDQVSSRFLGQMDSFRIRALLKLLESGTLSEEQHRLAREELAHKCTIYGSGCAKRGRHREAAYYRELAEKYA